MQALSRGFSQRRKTSSKPRDIHIRKVSVSGSSLSSGSSVSSTMSAASSTSSISPPCSASISRASTSRSAYCRSVAAGPDPLGSNPTFPQPIPPPRLCDRPLLHSPEQQHHFEEPATFFIEDDVQETPEPEDYFGDYSYNASEKTPAVDIYLSALSDDDADETETDDYFGIQVVETRPVLRSRWSDSTIASVESIMSQGDTESLADTEDDLSEVHDDNHVVEVVDSSDAEDSHGEQQQSMAKPLAGHQSMPNFSYKRDTMPRRPPIKTLDSLDDFIKRGGWKRRGIIFHNEDIDPNALQLSS
ncbi:hypothetical protein HIM_05772 [Hirsutella minnesotensis 3608]|uniref:AGC-kinase C-terminal domain-containing protein n=1 Tax=Hirsutella minnesotensis 3608 TaxID=1043627 RepID=A0A0F7ZUH3_9HYPO|nr:hypothetical protein HIM_05772 [Hirsutella minnesotensis 3608]